MIENIFINKQDLKIESVGDYVSFNKGNFSFKGETLLTDNRGLSLVSVNNFDEYAVLLSVDHWSTTNNYNVVIFSFDDINLSDFLYEVEHENLSPDEKINALRDFFINLKESFKDYQVEKTKITSAPNTSSFSASVSSKIEIREKYNNYNSNNNPEFVILGFLVGSGIKEGRLIEAVAMMASLYVNSAISNTSILYSNGTNFSSVGLRLKRLSKR